MSWLLMIVSFLLGAAVTWLTTVRTEARTISAQDYEAGWVEGDEGFDEPVAGESDPTERNRSTTESADQPKGARDAKADGATAGGALAGGGAAAAGGALAAGPARQDDRVEGQGRGASGQHGQAAVHPAEQEASEDSSLEAADEPTTKTPRDHVDPAEPVDPAPVEQTPARSADVASAEAPSRDEVYDRSADEEAVTTAETGGTGGAGATALGAESAPVGVDADAPVDAVQGPDDGGDAATSDEVLQPVPADEVLQPVPADEVLQPVPADEVDDIRPVDQEVSEDSDATQAIPVQGDGAQRSVTTGEGGEVQAPYGDGSAAPGTDGEGPAGWSVKGNVGSGLFHTPESPGYQQTRAGVWFRDVEAAKAAGFNHWDPVQR